MGINVELKKISDRELRFIIYDEDKHSLPNLITKLALKKPGVVYSAYILEHPIVSYPEVVIRTDGSVNPLEVLVSTIEEARVFVEEFLKKLDEAIASASEKRE
ncbi:MAG: DNA-directed RNA polymerase subunit L [Ignisphaera sp.]|nr:DNA-directed RNA polymerase subunit L [Ignisphaera sp.]MCX8168455.1 DNA-directed RNA polymerase subunit L [Ignisphaera sp.]MDW8085105.1 RpoL/Rpb11 RNA polymerase subunit family protein [Ignisphaera sp.]